MSDNSNKNPGRIPKHYIKAQGERLLRNWAYFPRSLLELKEEIESCQKCPNLVQTRKMYLYGKPTFSFGNPKSCVIIVAQAPGSDGAGTTGFVYEPYSKTGRIYENCLKAVNKTFESVYTTNLVKCCPIKGGTPTEEEIANCLPYLIREINIIQPKRVIATGSIPGKTLWENRKLITADISQIRHPGFIIRGGMKSFDYMRDFAQLLNSC